MLKRIVALSMSLAICTCAPFALSSEVSAMSATEFEPSEVSAMSATEFEPVIKPTGIGDHRIYYTKKDFDTYEEWGKSRRVSDNLRGNAGDTISVNRSISFNVQVSGEIEGLNISTSSSITSEKNYSMALPRKGTYYVVYRVRYQVERGTRVAKTSSGQVLGENDYEVKTPLYGEFFLREY